MSGQAGTIAEQWHAFEVSTGIDQLDPKSRSVVRKAYYAGAATCLGAVNKCFGVKSDKMAVAHYEEINRELVEFGDEVGTNIEGRDRRPT